MHYLLNEALFYQKTQSFSYVFESFLGERFVVKPLNLILASTLILSPS